MTENMWTRWPLVIKYGHSGGMVNAPSAARDVHAGETHDAVLFQLLDSLEALLTEELGGTPAKGDIAAIFQTELAPELLRNGEDALALVRQLDVAIGERRKMLHATREGVVRMVARQITTVEPAAWLLQCPVYAAELFDVGVHAPEKGEWGPAFKAPMPLNIWAWASVMMGHVLAGDLNESRKAAQGLLTC